MSKRKGKKTYYDPDPKRRSKRRRSRKGPRKGIEPPGLKRWRLSQRRKADPGYARTVRQGPRGGWFFAGPHKRRYDPSPKRRFAGMRGRFRSAGGKIERALSGGWGKALGAGLSAGAGLWQGFSEYGEAYGPKAGVNYLHTVIGGPIYGADGNKIGDRMPEIAHVFGLATKDELWGKNGLEGAAVYLKYKFLGLDVNNEYKGSAWVIPFWVSLGSWIASKLPLGAKAKRIQRPLNAISKYALAVSTIGALALPGSPQDMSSYSNIPNALPSPSQQGTGPTGSRLY